MWNNLKLPASGAILLLSLLLSGASASAQHLVTLQGFQAIRPIPSIQEIDFPKTGESTPASVAVPQSYEFARPSVHSENRRESTATDESSCGTLAPVDCTRAADEEFRSGHESHASLMFYDACSKGEPFACTRLGFYESERVGGDHELGTRLLERACKLGMSEACSGRSH